MRELIIAGNWKMHGTRAQATILLEGIKAQLPASLSAKVIVCPPFTALETASDLCDETPILVGAQTMEYRSSGAYTGEISPDMLTDLGVSYVIIGHSERRSYYGESDETVNAKLKAAFAHGLIPIMCLGESLAVREEGQTLAYIRQQLEKGLAGLPAQDVKAMVIAYEPIWAIGTGKTASSAQAEEVCQAIRQTVAQLYDEEVAQALHILYGGSVKGENARELMAQPNIDGALVGGASLKAHDFLSIIEEAIKE